jgi:hypothetical protein
MDVRKNSCFRFLATTALLIGVLPTISAPQAQRAATYVVPRADRCSLTKLRVELDGITPLPGEILLKIWRAGDNQEVLSQNVNLGDDGKYYYWSGLLVPLGKYKVQLFNAKDISAPLGIPFSFNNIDILKDFVNEERGEITYLSRGGDPSQTETERKVLPVDQLPKSNGHNKIHIVVINNRANKADEYYGDPPAEQIWKSKPLFVEQYRLVVVEYENDGRCKVLRGK